MRNIILLIIFLIPSISFSGTIVNNMNIQDVSIDDLPRIMCVGDSITVGYDDSPVLFGYRDHLQDYLGVNKYEFVGPYTSPSSDSFYDVDSWSAGGVRTAYILTEGTTVSGGPVSIGISNALTRYMPKNNKTNSKLLLLIGTNDSASSTGNNLPPPVDPSVAAANVVSIVNLILAYDSTIDIYVGLIVPHREFGSVKNNTNFINYNNILGPAILAINAVNPKVHLVDHYSAFTNDTFSLLSGNYRNTAYANDTHPNDLGYTVIAKQWASCIESSLNTNCDGN
jgi:lysophospholipase L1-like esterase